MGMGWKVAVFFGVFGVLQNSGKSSIDWPAVARFLAVEA
jgi:hypothetical protein